MKIRMTTTLGSITIQLNSEKAPKTVENFLDYAESGFFDGTIFHRVIKNFMIQGGGLEQDMKTKKTNTPIQNEANNDLSNTCGTISMARTADPHSASAQFFINTHDNLFLDFQSETPDGWGYCVFGKVVEGMDIVHNIEEQDTKTYKGFENVPETAVKIEKMIVLERDI